VTRESTNGKSWIEEPGSERKSANGERDGYCEPSEVSGVDDEARECEKGSYQKWKPDHEGGATSIDLGKAHSERRPAKNPSGVERSQAHGSECERDQVLGAEQLGETTCDSCEISREKQSQQCGQRRSKHR